MRLIAAAALLCLMPLSATPGLAQQQWHREYFPNVELTTQDGKKVRFYDDVIKGKVVAINFIFTSCGDVCPLDTAALRRVQKMVGSAMGRDIFFYSITVDPKHDTPAVLKKYRQAFGIGPGWMFLTGRQQDIDLIQKKLGVTPAKPGELRAHDTRFVMGNEAIARWIKRMPQDDPTVLANILTRDLPSRGMARDTSAQKSYAEAKPVTSFSSGASLFLTRCSACHAIGGSGDNKLGPDLDGVTERRARAWLVSWIQQPDKMRAKKDPIARSLMAKYPNLRMPNLGLSETNAKDIIDFIEDESRLRKATEKAAADSHEGHHHHGTNR